MQNESLTQGGWQSVWLGKEHSLMDRCSKAFVCMGDMEPTSYLDGNPGDRGPTACQESRDAALELVNGEVGSCCHGGSMASSQKVGSLGAW
jgi:hypothetical protein